MHGRLNRAPDIGAPDIEIQATEGAPLTIALFGRATDRDGFSATRTHTILVKDPQDTQAPVLAWGGALSGATLTTRPTRTTTLQARLLIDSENKSLSTPAATDALYTLAGHSFALTRTFARALDASPGADLGNWRIPALDTALTSDQARTTATGAVAPWSDGAQVCANHCGTMGLALGSVVLVANKMGCVCVPPTPGTSPSPVSGSAKRASCEHTMRSHSSAISSPPPTAWPCTAAIDTHGSVLQSRHTSR